MTREDIKTINDIVHKTIYGSFDICGDDEETPMTDKDKLLLEVNKAVCNNIKDLEQEPKTGHWEYVQYDYNPKFGNWHCSECRCIVVECVDKNEKGGIPLYKYCPQCGAKMEEQYEDKT